MSSSTPWAPPKSPLPPHRLAKIANALGVSTPVPAVHLPSSSDASHRAPTSKYLLHVIPPIDLPSDTDDLTAPPATASGYHPQFRRGTLVPLHASFQSQLAAIAKEYALPSTAGVILYLVSSTDEPYEPGPRLSEDIWRHLWTRVTSKDDNLRTPTPEPNGPPLRPLMSTVEIHPPPLISPISPSPSTQSSVSNPLHSSSSVSRSDTNTPDTSELDPQTRANSLDLPGLDSSSIIPILAKVEFDIDFRRAHWYDPWLRSRKMNHAKRAESRLDRSEVGDSPDDPQDRHRRISFLTGKVRTESPVSLVLSPAEDKQVIFPLESDSEYTPEPQPIPEYEELTDHGDSDSDSDTDDAFADEITARVTSFGSKDPLADVFGTDADTWADMQRSSIKRQTNPNVVELALTGADLTALPSPTQSEFDYFGKEIDEVQALLDQNLPPVHRLSGSKKHVPPPLILLPGPSNSPLHPETLVVPDSAGSVNLAYLQGQQPENYEDENYEDEDYPRTRTPAGEKREGAVYDDLDLGLEPSEDFDENDPDDHRRSQYLMMARLDQIERTMAQLSPRALAIDLEDDPSTGPTFSPTHLSPGHISSSPRNPSASPPRLALNGVATSAPPTFSNFPSSNEDPERQKQDLKERSSLSPDGPNFPNDPDPIIPLSPDPFGRHSPEAPRTSSVYWEKPPASFYSGMTDDVQNGVRSDSRATSRFSTDSLNPDGPASRPNATFSAVTSFKKLWKKSNNRSSSVTNTSSTQSSRAPTPIQPPSRPSQELSDGPPRTPTFSLFNASIPAPRQSMDQPPPPSPQPGQQFAMPPPPHPHPHPHPQQQHLPIPAPQQFPIPRPQQLPNPYNGRNPNPQPIRVAQMQPGRSSSTLNNFLFDQESPYPVHRAPSFPPRPLTPAAPPSYPASTPPPPPPPPKLSSDLPNPHMSAPPLRMMPSTSAPVAPPAQPPAKPSIRKSILKSWKSSGSGGSISSTINVPPSSSSSGGGAQETRTSTERPNAGKPQGRRPSVLNFGSTRGSVTSPPPDIPPSPQIPHHFLHESRATHKFGLNSTSSMDWMQSEQVARGQTKRTSASTVGSRPSVSSSRGSQDSRPSFDASQFEMVSPKMNSALSYPYHELDQES